MIIANGGSYWPQSQEIDRYFINQIDTNDKILFIPAATTRSQESYFNFFRQAMSNYGLNNIIWADLYQSWENEVKNAKVVYLAGGNTFKLIDILRSSGFDQFLCDFQKDKIIVGNSAGSVVLGENILTTNDEDIIGVKNYNGLKLLPYSISPHYSADKSNHLKKISQDFNLTILGIPEEGGIVLDKHGEKRIGHIKEFRVKRQ